MVSITLILGVSFTGLQKSDYWDYQLPRPSLSVIFTGARRGPVKRWIPGY